MYRSCYISAVRMLAKPLFFLLAMLVSAAASSATYVYTGPYYTSADGIYTTSMRITGAFTTVNPLPPNLSNVEIGPYGQNLVTSWSFNNGVTTFTNGNSGPTLASLMGGVNGGFVVSTDPAGNITGFVIGLQSPANTLRDVDVVVFRTSTLPELYYTSNLPACPFIMCAGPDSSGWAVISGSFTTLQPTAIPTLSGGGVLLLLGLMAVSTALYLRRKSG